MAVFYKLIEKGEPGVSGGGKRYLSASVVVNQTITPRQFEELVMKKTGLTKPNLVRSLYILKQLICEQLQEGNIVQTGVLGTFYPAIKRNGKLVPNKTNSNNLEPYINYRRSKEMKEEMAKADVKRVEGGWSGSTEFGGR